MNRPVEIVHGLEVTAQMHQLAATAVAEHLPHLEPLTWDAFTTPKRWWLVPDEEGNAYKAELVLIQPWRDEAGTWHDPGTAKVNIWYAADRRGGADPKPHNHPWPMRVVRLQGTYTEDQYWTSDDGSVQASTYQRGPGQVIDVPIETYHEVTELHGEAVVSLIVCGPVDLSRRWGYLDLATGQHTPAPPSGDPAFLAREAAINPQHNPTTTEEPMSPCPDCGGDCGEYCDDLRTEYDGEDHDGDYADDF